MTDGHRLGLLSSMSSPRGSPPLPPSSSCCSADPSLKPKTRLAWGGRFISPWAFAADELRGARVVTNDSACQYDQADADQNQRQPYRDRERGHALGEERGVERRAQCRRRDPDLPL